MESKVDGLIVFLKEQKLTSEEIFTLASKLIESEYDNGDISNKATLLGNMILTILNKYHQPKDAVGLLSDLASVICINNPKIIEEQISELKQIIAKEQTKGNNMMYGR